MGTYKITAVSSKVSNYDTQYGPMKSYKLKFAESDDAIVSLSQKASTPAPKVGDELNGTIDMSAEYGPKFKKEYAQPQAKGAYVPREDHHEDIKAEWAIGQAVEWLSSIQGADPSALGDVEALAKDFLQILNSITKPDNEQKALFDKEVEEQFGATPEELAGEAF